MKQIDADGINGDTQDGVPLGFSLAADKIGHPLAFEPEGGPSDEALSWNVMTWGQYAFPFIPMVDRYKWLETRHMVNISDRWNLDKTNDLQLPSSTAWAGRAGKISGASGTASPPAMPRPRAALRPSSAESRRSWSARWEPLYPMHNFGVYASRWPLGEQTVWTIVNRNDYDIGGPPDGCARSAGNALLRSLSRGGVEARAEGDRWPCSASTSKPTDTAQFLPRPANPSDAIKTLMQRMASMTAEPLATFSHESDRAAAEHG